jgi:hypothetical protein
MERALYIRRVGRVGQRQNLKLKAQYGKALAKRGALSLARGVLRPIKGNLKIPSAFRFGRNKLAWLAVL